MPRLTTRLITQAPADADVFLWDDQIPGFGLRCRCGQKSYVLQYRVIGGRGSRQRRVTLGRVGSLSLDDARVLAQEYLRGVRYGQDPAAARQAMRAHARRRQPVVSARSGAWASPGQSAQAVAPYPGGCRPGGRAAARSAAHVRRGRRAGRVVAADDWALLGHTEPQTTQRYAHLVDHPVQAAAEQVGEAIRRALGG